MSTPPERRLAAILCADVVGYSRLMEGDEAGTLAAFRAHRSALIDPLIVQHDGRVFKTTGDGLLVEFASVVQAVGCALAIQTGMAGRNRDVEPDRRLELRIAVNLGDVVVEGTDLLGDGVVVAARLEQLAEPGGICVSDAAHQQLSGKIDATFTDLGPRSLRNLQQPVRVWAWRAHREDVLAPAPPTDRPSIVILPFQNMSGDPDQEFFADGMTEEVTALLARLPYLFVTARNSAFTYKGRAVDVRTVAREMGVRHVLEGSVRKSGPRIRITAQLIDAASGAHTWSDTYDRDLTEIFAVQEELGHAIAGALMPRIIVAEATLAARKQPESLDAWGFTVRALVRWWADSTQPTAVEVIRYARAATALDPDYGLAHGFLSNVLGCCGLWNWTGDWLATSREAAAEAKRAIELAPHESAVLLNVALCYFQLGRFVAAARIAEQAVEAGPNDAQATAVCGLALAVEGRTDEAIRLIESAFRLSPRDPHLHFFYQVRSCAAFFADRHEEAISWAARCLRAKPNFPGGYLWLAAAQAAAGHIPESKRSIEKLRALVPRVSLETFKRPSTEGTQWQKMVDALSAAGV